MTPFNKILIKSSLFQHLIFWVLSFYAIGSYFSISNEIKFIDFIYSSFFHLPLLFLVYINLRINIPYFLEKERYLLYALISLVCIVTAYAIHQLVFDFMIPILPTDFYMVSFTEANVLLSIFSMYLIISTLIRLSKSWYKLQQSEKEKLSLELNSLKMQINPHFLFNSLNSIYSLSRKKSDTTPNVILGLSNLLRYMIYEVPDELVPLEKEIEAIKNYVKLQRLRLEEDTKLNLDFQIEDDKKLIAPLLFFPLIENSFKHGLNGEAEDNFVTVQLISTSSNLTFNVRNNKAIKDNLENGKYGGIGLENVTKRLKLIYGDKASLNITEDKGTFEVTIKLTWDD